MERVPVSDWIFFTSKNSVRFFFQQGLQVGERKVGCVGKGTMKTLAQFVANIDFIGNAVDVQKVGSAFQELVGNGTCVFPVSDISKRTIQRYFRDPSKAIDLVVYATQERTQFDHPKADVLIFTSPSNARAYYNMYPSLGEQVVAMGPTTAQQLEELKIPNTVQPKSTGEMGLIDAIR